MRDLLGTDSPPLRRFAIVWTLLAGWVLSSTVFLLFQRDAVALLLLGLVPAGMGALAVARATRDREAKGGAVIGACVLAALATPLVMLSIIGALVVLGNGLDELGPVLGAVCLGSIVGAFFAAPLGLIFGTAYATLWVRLQATRAAGRGALEDAWVVFGLASVLLGAFDGLLAAAVPAPVHWFQPPPRPDLLVPLTAGAVVFGLLTLGRGLALKRRRRRLAERVARGHVPGWAVVDPESFGEVPGGLPVLFVRPAHRLLVRRRENQRGPFRSNEVVEAVAWM